MIVIGLALGIGTGILGSYLFRSQLVRLIPSVRVTAHSLPGAQPPNSKGLDAAPVVIEEFSDFQCPPCKGLFEQLKKIEGKYGSQLKVVYRHYPIESLHNNAFEAARTAEAARLQGRFWDMHDQLFEKQGAWASNSDPKPLFAAYARSMNLDMARFQNDVSAPETSERIIADQRRGDSIRVPGTPVVLVNGQQVPPDAIDYAGLQAAIERELKSRSACSGGCLESRLKP